MPFLLTSGERIRKMVKGPRPPDRRRTEPPHYADPISCPVLTVGAQAYLGFFAGG